MKNEKKILGGILVGIGSLVLIIKFPIVVILGMVIGGFLMLK
jgi:hypothetical protein